MNVLMSDIFNCSSLILSSINGTSRGGKTDSFEDWSEPLSCCPFGAMSVDRHKQSDLTRRIKKPPPKNTNIT